MNWFTTPISEETYNIGILVGLILCAIMIGIYLYCLWNTRW